MFCWKTGRLSHKDNDKSKDLVPGRTPLIFFDRDPQHFPAVLDVYRKREIHICERTCALGKTDFSNASLPGEGLLAVIQQEFLFWGLEEVFMQPCCSLKYFPKTVSARREMEEERKEQNRNKRREREETFGDSGLGRVRMAVWDILEYPETSKDSPNKRFHGVLNYIFAVGPGGYLCLPTGSRGVHKQLPGGDLARAGA